MLHTLRKVDRISIGDLTTCSMYEFAYLHVHLGSHVYVISQEDKIFVVIQGRFQFSSPS